MELTPEQIGDNYERFVTLTKRCSADKQPGLDRFFAHMEQRLALCPGSSRVHFHNCFPGGLVEHSIRVLTNCNKLMQVYKDVVSFTKEEMVFGCLFHDIGKIGGINEERYVPQTSDWHRKQGSLYEYNPKMPFMTTPDMGIFLMQHFGIPMTHDEMLAIKLNDGHFDEANAAYKLKEGYLALLVHQADVMATLMEKTGLQEGNK